MPEGKHKCHPNSSQKGTVNLSVRPASTGGIRGPLTPGCPNEGRVLRDQGFTSHAPVTRASLCQG